MAIKNINEIQAGEYSKHTEQFYIDSLSALANSGQRYGTPGAGFADTCLSIKDIYPEIQNTDISYIQCTVSAIKDDLERYAKVSSSVLSDYSDKSYIRVKQISYLDNGQGYVWDESVIDEFSYLESKYEPDDFTFILDETDDKTLNYQVTGVKTNGTIENFCGGGVQIESTDKLFSGETEVSYIKTNYILLTPAQRTKISNLNTVNTNYVFNKKYSIDPLNHTLSYYELSTAQITDTSAVFVYKKYLLDVSQTTVCAEIETAWQASDIKYYDSLLAQALSEVAPKVSSFEMTWDEAKAAFLYSGTDDDIIIYNNKILKTTLEAFLKNISNNNDINKLFFKKILLNEFCNYYSKLSDDQLLNLLGGDNKYLYFNIYAPTDCYFNLLTRTGVDGNIIDDTYYYNTASDVAINQCVTSDFANCVEKFILNKKQINANGTCFMISDASLLYNADTLDKYITNLYKYNFIYMVAGDNTEVLSPDLATSYLYTMPYINDNGYWTVNNAVTGTLATRKHGDKPSVIIIHIYKSDNGTNTASTKTISVTDTNYNDNTSISRGSVYGEIISTYMSDDLKKVNFKPYTAVTENLLSVNNILTKYSVPCYLPDAKETITDANLNYITDYLKSALFVCVTDIDCVPEAESYKSSLEGAVVTTFWVYDEDKENSTYFKPLLKQDGATAADLSSLTNVSSIVRYASQNIKTTPDKEFFSHIVFDTDINDLKQTANIKTHYPFIKNISSKHFNKSTEGNAYNIGVIPISDDYTNNANLIISFSDTVETENGRIKDDGIISYNNKGAWMAYEKSIGAYLCSAVEYDSSYDYILNAAAQNSFIDTLDLSGVIVNHNNIYNRTNLLIPSKPEYKKSYVYASYIGTDPASKDKSYLVIGTTDKRYDISPSLLNSAYTAPFKRQNGLKVEMDNFIVNAANEIDLTGYAASINCTKEISICSTGYDVNLKSDNDAVNLTSYKTNINSYEINLFGYVANMAFAWQTTVIPYTYSAVFSPVFYKYQQSNFLETIYNSGIPVAYKIKIDDYLSYFYKIQTRNAYTAYVQYLEIGGDIIATSPVSVVAYMQNIHQNNISKICSVKGLQFYDNA
jgi:hypothetical protein